MRILLGLVLLAASFLAHPFDRGVAQAQQIVLPCVPSGNSCIPVSAANPLPTTGGASGITIGTTTITGGATTQVLFNLGGVVSSDTGFTYAGSGGVLNTGTQVVGGGGLTTCQVTLTPNSGVNSCFGSSNGGSALTFFLGAAQHMAFGAGVTLVSSDGLRWTNSSTNANTTLDTSIFRSSGGVLEIGTGGNNASGSLLLTNITASGANVLLTGINATTETDMLCFNTGTGLVTHSTIAQQCTVSDINKKQEIIPIDPQRALQIVLNLDPISFRYRPEVDMGNDRHTGFTLQRVAAVEPELATPTGVKYGEMNALWAAAIQALKADNDNLRSEFADLKRTVNHP